MSAAAPALSGIHFEISADANSGRHVEVGISALVSDAEGAPAPGSGSSPGIEAKRQRSMRGIAAAQTIYPRPQQGASCGSLCA